MTSFVIGLASGLGNSVFMLPAIAALKSMGHHIALYVQNDFNTADLWRRCIYADEIILPPETNLNGHTRLCGQWRPPSWQPLTAHQYQTTYPYRTPEWLSNLRLAKYYGFSGDVDVSDWCRDLDRAIRFDVGLVPGSKSGLWIRKRWPGMKQVAEHFLSQGMRVGVFGQESDGVAEIPGQWIKTTIGQLPDALAGCRVVVGTDSGVTHLAASLGIPCVIIYTGTSKVKGEPVTRRERFITISTELNCQPCQTTPRWNACSDWKCQQINPDRVIEAAEKLLEGSK